MHITSSESALLPREYRRTNEYERSDLQASNGQPLYAVAEAPGYVVLGEWSCSLAGKAAYLTSLRKLGWSGRDLAVYVDRAKSPEGEGDVDFFDVGGIGHLVTNEQGMPLRVFMPEKMFTAPSSPNAQTARVIYAACDEDGVGYILENLRTDPLIGGIRGLEDYWTIGGKIWVIAHGPRASIQEPVERVLRIYGFDGRVEQEAKMSCVAYRRPVFAQNKLIFPVQRWPKGPWELTTGSECLWKGFDISNLYARRDGVHCLVSERPGIWRVLRGQSVSTFGHLGELVGDVSVWSGELLFHLRGWNDDEFVVYGGSTCRPFSEIDHASLRVFEREPVFAARNTRGTGSWNLVYDDEIISKTCDSVLEAEAAPKILKACVLRGNQIVVETYKV